MEGNKVFISQYDAILLATEMSWCFCGKKQGPVDNVFPTETHAKTTTGANEVKTSGSGKR